MAPRASEQSLTTLLLNRGDSGRSKHVFDKRDAAVRLISHGRRHRGEDAILAVVAHNFPQCLNFKGEFTQNCNFTHLLPTLMSVQARQEGVRVSSDKLVHMLQELAVLWLKVWCQCCRFQTNCTAASPRLLSDSTQTVSSCVGESRRLLSHDSVKPIKKRAD